jgi:hypothetical protein
VEEVGGTGECSPENAGNVCLEPANPEAVVDDVGWRLIVAEATVKAGDVCCEAPGPDTVVDDIDRLPITTALASH